MVTDGIWPDSAVFTTALIAGEFALANTQKKRVERFKEPNEVAQTCPDNLNRKNMLQAAILCELYAIDQATDPVPSLNETVYVRIHRRAAPRTSFQQQRSIYSVASPHRST